MMIMHCLLLLPKKKGNKVVVNVEGKRNVSEELNKINVNLFLAGKIYLGSGSVQEGVTITLK